MLAFQKAVAPFANVFHLDAVLFSSELRRSAQCPQILLPFVMNAGAGRPNLCRT